MYKYNYKMGIRHLNRYLRTNCPNSIRCIQLADLAGKRIAVDISIYLYKYEAENTLLENIYLMLSIFRHHNIIPIFIFDGKPPPEKKQLLMKRKMDKQNAQEEYSKLQAKLSENADDIDKQEIIGAMDQLKKQFVQISKDKIDMVKELIRAYGATYYDALGEADALCALLVLKKKVWACMSEDMDMFVYGCTRVLRYFSLVGHTAVLYYMRGILEELKMNQTEFTDICVLSGTDYNMNSTTNQSHLHRTLSYFQTFKDTNIDNQNHTFYDWLLQHTDYISNISLLHSIKALFDLNTNYHSDKLDIFKKISIVNGPKMVNEIRRIMETVDFMFI